MSSIILHDKTNNDWNSLGFGPLVDAMNPKVTREKHGIYDLQFQYPVNGPLFDELKIGRWIVSDAGPTIVSQAQRFEIATITKPIDGIVTVYCEHKRYQLLRTIVKVGEKMSTTKAQLALNRLLQLSEPKSDFTYFSDVQTDAGMDFSDPAKFENVQSALGGVRGSILDNFGGEYLFDNNKVSLLQSAGKESNVIIAYGKNLTDVTQEESIESTYTSVYGWAKDEEGKVITLPETYIDSEYVGSYTQRRIQMKDFSDETITTTAQLRTAVQNFIKNNKIGVPKVSIKAKYEELSSSVNADNLKLLESIDLCDYVTISFNQLGINTSAQIVKTVWNVGLDKYDSVELGDARTDFAKVLEDNKTDTGQIEDKLDWLEDAQNEASNILNNPGRGNVVIYPSLADPQEILIMDTKDIDTAKNVWKWNAGGLGFSSTGYNGTYDLAMTNNGAIVADRVTTGTLKAINIIGVTISGSTITSDGDNYRITMNNGKMTWYSKDKKKNVISLESVDSPQTDVGVVQYKMEPGGGFRILDTKSNLLMSSYDNGDSYGPWLSFNASNFIWSSSPYGGNTRISANKDQITLNAPTAYTFSGGNITGGSGSWGIYSSQETFFNSGLRVREGLSVAGGLSVSGTKSSLVTTKEYGDRLLYAFETPEYLFATYGKATTNEDGYAQVEIEPMFLETINTDSKNYHVFVSPYSKSTAYADYLEKDRFLIKSDKPNVEVSWQLVAYRKGYEDFYLETPETNGDKSPDLVQYPLENGNVKDYEEVDHDK
ncbi:phage tail spike protein [Enterococcus pseudoavium]|uniref:Phage tail spike protein n=1 Tax=Enterococcus pseudoavium TaxID=44007 RepID=A0AAE4L789_9ENTE|nr:phage tail spike protein [Enterococcus pseudoavium]MDT2738062.1 phage tail spike protein [Enterococcus pseudoavium]